LYFQYWDAVAAVPQSVILASLFTADTSSHRAGFVVKVAKANFAYWWLEGDQVTYLHDDGLYGMPLDGSAEPTRLTELLLYEEDNVSPTSFVLESEFLYWSSREKLTSAETKSWSIWRATRATGERAQLASMPVRGPSSGLMPSLTVTADKVIVFEGLEGLSNTLYAIPKAGGDPQVLPAPTSARMIGIAPDGSALWQGHPSAGDDGYQLWLSTADGAAPSPAWLALPSSVFATDAWPDGSGGWSLVAQEITPASSPMYYTSVWWLEPTGGASRLACTPLPGTPYTRAAALSPTSFFLLQQDGSSLASKSIVSIAR
jgi:hypothetical protein